MNKSIDDFTLVIPTKNRPVFLKRLLVYCNTNFPSIRILIADSSDESLLTNLESLLELVPRHKVSSCAFPPSLTFFEKIVAVIGKVDTDYMALLADDDFLLPGPLPRCLEILRSDANVSCVQGAEVFFRPGTSVGSPNRMLLDFHGGSSFDSSSANARLLSLFGSYRASMYGIRRTQDFLEDSLAIIPLQSQFMLMEMAFGALDVIRGKLIRLPLVLTMRESHSLVAYHQYADVTYWERVLFAPDFSNWLKCYLHIVATRLAYAQQCSLEAAEETVRESLRLFSISHFVRLSQKSLVNNSLLKRVRPKLFSLPGIGQYLSRAWFRIAKWYDYARLLRKHGDALRQADFKNLVKILESYFGFKHGSFIQR